MKQAATRTMRWIWPVILALIFVVLSAGQGHAHSGGAESRNAPQTPIFTVQYQAHSSQVRAMPAAIAIATPGTPCCPIGASTGTCCASIGCVAAAAVLSAAGMPIVFEVPRSAALAPPPRDAGDGIRGTPPLPPPRFFAAIVIG